MTQPDPSQYPSSDATPPTQSAYPPQYPAAPPAYPGGYGDPYNPYGQPQQARNGMGIAGMVLGIISLILCWITWPATIVGILAIIFGAIGRSRAGKGQATNKGQALAGLITGILGTILSIVVLVLVFNTAKSCLDKYPDQGVQYRQCVTDKITGNSN